MTKDEYLAIFKDAFSGMEEKRLAICMPMIDQCAFMASKIDELQEEIEENGMAEAYQYGSKPRAEVDLHLKYTKQYAISLGKLIDNLPKEEKANNELLEFLKR